MSEPSEKQINVAYEKVGKIIQDQIKLLSNATNLEDIKRKRFYEGLKSTWHGSIGARGPWQKVTGSDDAAFKVKSFFCCKFPLIRPFYFAS